MTDSVKAVWSRLESLAKPRLTELFAADPDRLAKLSQRLELQDGGILFDWSKTHLDDAHIDGFLALAEAQPGPLRCFIDMDDAFAHVRHLKGEE